MKVFAIPDPEKITGQSEVSRVVSDIIKPQSVVLLNKGIFHILLFIIRNFYLRPKFLYITLSRSRLGSFRDFLIIFFLKPMNLISHIHGMGFNNNYFFLKKNIYLTNSLILLTELSKRKFAKSFYDYEGEIKIIENPVLDKNLIARAHTNDINILNIFFFSNLIHSKGINEFISLSKSYSNNYNFNIAGRNIDKIKLDTNTINYFGVLKGLSKIDFISKNHILIFYSYYEEEYYPISLIESIYSGKMCIVKRHNDLDTTFKNCNIEWVDTYSDLELLLKNKKLLFDKYQAHSIWYSENLEFIKKRFSKANFEDKIKKIFN